MTDGPGNDGQFLTPLQRSYLERYPEATVLGGEETEHRKPEIRGLLWWIIASMRFFCPLLSLFEILLIYSGESSAEVATEAVASGPQKLISAAIIAIYALGSGIVGWRLAYRREKSSVVIAMIFIGASTALGIVGMIVGPVRGGGGSVVTGIVWLIYLSCSKTVKAVYSDDSFGYEEIFE